MGERGSREGPGGGDDEKGDVIVKTACILFN